MKLKVIIPVTLFVVSLMFITNCKKNTATHFLIQVDSIHMPDTIQVGDTLKIVMFGTIGENGCYSLDQIEPFFDDTTLTIKVWGLNSGDDTCPGGIVYLDGASLSIMNFQQGVFRVLFIQPDDGKLEETIVVI